MAKSKKLRDLNPVGRLPYGVYSRYDEYINLLMNALAIYEKGERMNFALEAFIKKALIERGSVGHDKISNKWAYIYGEGLNELGNPTNFIFVTANGKTFNRPAYYENDPDGAYFIKALPYGGFCISGMIKETTDFMTNCDVAMRQNLEACKTPYIVVCKDEDLRLSFESAIQDKQTGKAVLLVSPDLGEGLKAVNIEAEYLVDKFAEARDSERDTLLNKLGIITSNTDKRERIQSAEVNATIGQATDYIYSLIDTFNAQMKTYGIECEMRFNGSMEEIYLNETEESPDVNRVEEENETL